MPISNEKSDWIMSWDKKFQSIEIESQLSIFDYAWKIEFTFSLPCSLLKLRHWFHFLFFNLLHAIKEEWIFQFLQNFVSSLDFFLLYRKAKNFHKVCFLLDCNIKNWAYVEKNCLINSPLSAFHQSNNIGNTTILHSTRDFFLSVFI